MRQHTRSRGGKTHVVSKIQVRWFHVEQPLERQCCQHVEGVQYNRLLLELNVNQ